MPGQQQGSPKPLAGKVFYLDLPSNRRAEALESDLKLLGGTVEKFFSKEIKYLVSNKREAKYVECLRHELAAPSPESGQSSPFPYHKDCLKSGSQGGYESGEISDVITAERQHGRAKINRDKKQTGFCECCLLQYDNLRKHEQSERHLAFTNGSEYLVLDSLVSTMQCHFAVLKNKTKRPKCSVPLTTTLQGQSDRDQGNATVSQRGLSEWMSLQDTMF
ncbi:hypothetical protein CRUP_034909 [Coryphaenoides rupestris]|nr:hypothetical protein CRUP_034909 [Coryphaenoides rupestris]